MQTYYLKNGDPIHPLYALDRGGEGTITTIRGMSTSVAKILLVADAEHAAKVATMIANAPGVSDVLMWPKGQVFNVDGEAVGFLMPYVDRARFHKLYQVFQPQQRVQVMPHLTWAHLLRICLNIARVLQYVQVAGYAAADVLNDTNLLVSQTAILKWVDLDSLQVPNPLQPGAVFACKVGKSPFLAPELQHNTMSVRTHAQDSFALGVLIFLLLMEGVHPFTGRLIYQSDGRYDPAIKENILADRQMFVSAGAASTSDYALLPPSLRDLLQRAFSQEPQKRPTTADFVSVLQTVEQHLLRCRTDSFHVYPEHLAHCPFCIFNRNKRLFPPLVSGQQKSTPAQSPLVQPVAKKPGGRGQFVPGQTPLAPPSLLPPVPAYMRSRGTISHKMPSHPAPPMKQVGQMPPALARGGTGVKLLVLLLLVPVGGAVLFVLVAIVEALLRAVMHSG